jgi:hypothetical protein
LFRSARRKGAEATKMPAELSEIVGREVKQIRQDEALPPGRED